MAGIKSIHWPYDQLGIVTTVAYERPHGGKAVLLGLWERLRMKTVPLT